MTIIECFERSPVENIATCLSLSPDTLIFIGKGEALREEIGRYRLFLQGRGLTTNILLRETDGTSITDITRILTDIITAGDECIIDLAGGDEIALAAAGAVYERYKDIYPVSLQRFDVQTGAVEDSDGDGQIEMQLRPQLSVGELVSLHGGSISTEHPPLEDDPEPLWQVMIEDAGHFNRMVNALGELERRAGVSSKERTVTLNLKKLSGEISSYADKRALFDRLMDKLEEKNIITLHCRDEREFSYTYRTSLARYCLRKSGNTLECKTLLEARRLQKDGVPFFSDAQMGVTIDWDGITHHPTAGVQDTKNEIDVVLMHGLSPLFISCKNGGIDEEELYKLSTVTDRFGGQFAKKLLIATDFRPESVSAKRALLQRAEDMGILFEPDASALTEAGWRRLLTHPFQTKKQER